MNIGTPCRVSYRLRRDRDEKQRTWVKDPLPAPLSVYYIGYRWLDNGVMAESGMSIVGEYPGEPEYHEDYFSSNEHFRVALVVKNERTNPFYVRWEDVTS